MYVFSYKMEHDLGLAPNPFWGVMSLAVCKGHIRNNRNLQIGDWIIGTGGKEMGYEGRLIFAMKIERKITFDEYWLSPEFECKRPVINGTLVQMYGDNFYHTDKDGIVKQEKSAHNLNDGSTNQYLCERDARGKYVLLSKTFFYFGDTAPIIPSNMNSICCKSRDYQYKKHTEEVKTNFLSWLKGNFSIGIHGDPITWSLYDLPKMNSI